MPKTWVFLFSDKCLKYKIAQLKYRRHIAIKGGGDTAYLLHNNLLVKALNQEVGD